MVVGKSRLPMAVAVVVLMVAAIVAPRQLAVMPGWVLATVEGLLLVALIVQELGNEPNRTVAQADVDRARGGHPGEHARVDGVAHL